VGGFLAILLGVSSLLLLGRRIVDKHQETKQLSEGGGARALATAAAALDFTQARGRASGVWRGVTMQVAARPSLSWALAITVEGMPLDVQLERQLAPGVGHLTGDISFDTSYCVRGPEGTALARLDRGVRASVLATPGAVWLRGGQLGLELARGPSAGDVQGAATALARLVEALSESEGGEARLLARLERAEEPWKVLVRIGAFLTDSEDPDTHASLRAIADGASSASARLLAADAIWDRSILRGLAEDGAVAPELRRRALEALPSESLAGWAGALVAAWLVGEDDALALQGLRVVPHLDASEPALEPALIAALVRSDVPAGWRLHALRALKSAGGADAVAAITPFTQGLTTEASVKRGAREAVEAIQSRLVHTGEGAFSLAGEGGAISVSDAPTGGEVSLPGPLERER